jgi:LmbE family N-acetylglucosaminyl deacetylase
MRRFVISVLTVAMLVAGFCFQGPVSHAQVRAEYDIGALGLGQLLRRLQTTASAMHTGAHPDDEDSSLISRLARGDSARVAYLSLNRGEGGQNIIGPELLEPLGVIRTEELLQARKLDGGTQLFTRTFDYGFSKTRDEASSKWNEQLVLGDVVRAIRMFRPLVIISRFTGTKADGHGQHQFSGYITPLAFKAAADPKAFPEQMAEGLYPWQAKKLYVGQSFGENSGNAPTLRVQTGSEDPLIGRTYFEIAAEGRSQHKTQEMGMIEMRGPQSSGIRLVQSSAPIKREEISVFDDIDTSITGIRALAGLPDGVIDRDLKRMQESAAATLSSYTAFNPHSIIPRLAEGLTATRSARTALAGFQGDRAAKAAADSLLAEKERQFSEALERAAGVVMDALANSETIAAGETLQIAVKIYFPESSALKVNEVKVIGPTSWKFETAPEPAASQDQIFRFFREKPQSSSFFNTTVPMDAPLSQPYWLARPRKGAMFDWPEGTTKNLPFDGPLLVAEAQTEIGGVKVTVSRPVQFRYADNIRGEIRRDVNVVPKVTADLDTSVIVVPTSDAVQTRKLTVRLVNNSQTPLKGEVQLIVPKGWEASPSNRPLGFSRKGEQANTTFELTVPKNASPGSYSVEARAVVDGTTYSQQMQTIAYPHISTHRIYSPADALVQVVDLKVANVKVGYIAGSGDQVPEGIEQMGVPVTLLNETDLSAGDLSRFDTIVVGVRASEVRPDFVANNKRLFEFVNGGGTLIVQYQRPDYVARGLQPYPAKIGSPGAGPRVTDEDAPVRILRPEHPAFNFPNKINQADWQGWVLERTVFNFTNFDSRYTPLLESHDPGEGDETGGEVVAEIGKGRYVYTSYAWFRQLPAGVPGAYRLFANLISLSKAPKPNVVTK